MDRPIPRRRWTAGRIGLLAGACLAVGAAAYGVWKENGAARLDVDPEKLTVSRVERGSFQEFVPVQGEVLPGRTVYLDALEGGRVEEILAEEGSLVDRGAPLLRLANEDLRLQVMSQEAPLAEQLDRLRQSRLEKEQGRLRAGQELLNIEFQLQQKRRRYEKYASFSARDLAAVMPRAEFEQLKDEYEYYLRLREFKLEANRQDSVLAQLQVEQLEGAIDRMQRQVEQVRRRLDDLVLRAPVAGQLSALDAEIGQSKGRGERLGQIDRLDRFKVQAEVDEFYIARVQKGQRARFDLSGEGYELAIDKVYPQVKEGRFQIDLEFLGTPPAGIRRGQTLHLRLELGSLEQAVLLPRGGFYQKTGGNWAYVLAPDGGQARRRAIRLGRQNPQVFEVLEGLEPGERVITSGYDSFGDMDVLVLK
jgi:HlyD family secretion protein